MRKVDAFNKQKRSNGPAATPYQMVKLVIEHLILYKRQHRASEQKLRGGLAHNKDLTEYFKQVLLDCKKKTTRKDESRIIMYKLLNMTEAIYDEELSTLGISTEDVEKKVYKDVVSDLAKNTIYGRKIKSIFSNDKAKDLKEEYEKQLSTVVNYLSLHSDFQKKVMREALRAEDAGYLRHMIVLDMIYQDYHLNDIDFDIVISEDTPTPD